MKSFVFDFIGLGIAKLLLVCFAEDWGVSRTGYRLGNTSVVDASDRKVHWHYRVEKSRTPEIILLRQVQNVEVQVRREWASPLA